jgi:phosphatidylglycerol:prolipoprotein diacylglycerol transferase
LVFHLSCAVILAKMQRHGWLRGQLVKLYILAYLVYRFVSEFIRPEPKWWLDLSVYQWTALVLVPVFVVLWLRDRPKVLAVQSTASAKA